MSSRLPRLGVWGYGSVGIAVAELHAASGGIVSGVVSRNPAEARRRARDSGAIAFVEDVGQLECDVLMVCVPDAALPTVAARIAGGLVPTAWIFHTSGAHGGAALGAGDRIGSLHPLQSFPRRLVEAGQSAILVERARAAHWFHEGHGVDVARSLVAGWDATFHALEPGGKALYHAAAVTVSNHVVALLASAREMMEAAGLDADASMPAFHALLAGTVENVAQVGVADALTGPVERGDTPTVRAHLEALRRGTRAETVELYRRLGLRAVELAVVKGSLRAEEAQALRETLGLEGGA